MRHLALSSFAVLLLLAPLNTRAEPPRWRQAYVADARLATLRERAGLQAPLLKRLRAGRRVWILSRGRDRDGFAWVRVAVTRRTRGWILESAIAIPGDTRSERRLGTLLQTTQGISRIQVARLARDRFRPLREIATRALDEEAEHAARELTVRARRRLGPLDGAPEAEIRALMLSDPGLDRYNRLGVLFDVDPAARRYMPIPQRR